MKAILLKQFGDRDQLYLGRTEKPVPGENQVLVKVEAAALNRADILQRKGQYPPPAGASDILGMEISGRIVETNPANTEVLGGRVMALISGGGYAEYATVPLGLLLPIPENLDFVQAAGVMEAFLTGWQALKWLAEVKPGQKVLVHAGASGVGSACIQLAKNMRAEVVITASASKLDFCRDLGADHCIDYSNEDFRDFVLNHLSGVDAIIDFIGASYFQKNLQSLTRDGRLIMLGLLGGHKPLDVNLGPILFNRLTIIGSTLRSRSLDYRTRLVQDFQAHCYQHLQDGRLSPIIDRVFPWQSVKEAHQYMEENKNMGKIVLTIE
ncbi:MAG: NAD(P)H quinone oxidoreductase [Cyclobacteriaceae bacterium]|nr:MAG: NAD(P)H quinone oxidoreductase [Cyclobacteriaceae bacterium]